jgi:hypothetical protein
MFSKNMFHACHDILLFNMHFTHIKMLNGNLVIVSVNYSAFIGQEQYNVPLMSSTDLCKIRREKNIYDEEHLRKM